VGDFGSQGALASQSTLGFGLQPLRGKYKDVCFFVFTPKGLQTKAQGQHPVGAPPWETWNNETAAAG
jgi:hypothetical protein